jgi:hypothetical protein
MDNGVGGETVKLRGVMVVWQYVPCGVVQSEWALRRKSSVIAEWRLKDAMADNEPSAEGVDKGRCVAWAETYVEVRTVTAAGVEVMVDVDCRFDKRD